MNLLAWGPSFSLNGHSISNRIGRPQLKELVAAGDLNGVKRRLAAGEQRGVEAVSEWNSN